MKHVALPVQVGPSGKDCLSLDGFVKNAKLITAIKLAKPKNYSFEQEFYTDGIVKTLLGFLSAPGK